MPVFHIRWSSFIRTHHYGLTLFILLCISVFLRLYRLPETIRFSDDQGLDMVGIWQMKNNGVIPLVGPFLSIPNVHTPPTYYAITWGMYTLTKSVVGVVFGYAILNLFTIGILTALAYQILGKRAALIICLLLSVSNIMMDHSRTFWQPYPIQFFLALFLLFLWHGIQKKRLAYMLISVIWYQIALSIYPAPVLLLPFVIYHLIHGFRRITHVSRVSAVLYTFLTLMITGSIVFLPQIIFEARHGFPTVTSLFSFGTLPYMMHPITSVLQNTVQLISVFFATDSLPNTTIPWGIIALSALYLLVIVMVYTNRTPYPHPFFAPWMLAVGLCGFLLYPFDVHPHRTWAFLPFAFLLTADLLNRAWDAGRPARIGGIILIVGIVSVNLFGAMRYWTGVAPNQIAITKGVAQYILSDMKTRGVSDQSAGFFYKVPNDPHNGSYKIYRILFWLIRDGGVSFPFDGQNVQLPHNYSTPQIRPIMYVICRGFDQASIHDECIRPVMGSVPYQQLTQKKLGLTIVSVLSTATTSAMPDTHYE